MSAPAGAAPAPTAEQARAADPATSAWVSANAGSGKTHVLVERVLRLLLAGVEPSRILCLTFTRAAASEMANRVFDRLALWAAADDPTLRAIIALTDGEAPDAERLAFARTLFARALETPGGLKIQTIHAFCERLLHQFAFEANVTAHFKVMDTALTGELHARAIDAVLADAERGEALAKALDHMAALAGELRFADLIGAVVAARRPLTLWHGRHGGLDAALGRLRGQLGVADDDSMERIAEEWLNPPSLPQADWADCAAALLAASAKMDKERGEALSRAARAGDELQRLAAWKAVLLTQQGMPRKKLYTDAFARAHPDWAEAMSCEVERATGLLARERAIEVFEATSALLRLGTAAVERLEAEKSRSGLLDYDDLIERALRLLSQQDAAAWVLYKLDGGIDHILVDEAQDTNAQQWSIVRLLAEEFFAGASARLGLRTIFAVGDEKQSIYSFQGAEPAEFERMRGYFSRRIDEAAQRFEKINLIVSFRSVQIVLDAVDDVFRQDTARQGLSEADEAIVHTASRSGDPGLVELWPLEVPSEEAPSDPWDAPLDRPSPDHPRLRLAAKVAREVTRLVGGATLIERGGERRVVAGDILILVRRRNDLVDALIATLRRSGIPVAGADRLILGEHLSVQDLMAAGDVSLLPEDDLTLAAVLKSPLIGLSEDELFTLAHGRSGSLWAALRQHADVPVFAVAQARIDQWMARADTIRPFEFFSTLLTRDNGRLLLLQRLGPEAADAMDEFLSLALAYEEIGPASLQGFLHWMRGQSIDIKRNMEEGHGAVRIMTVHGAKGLEAPIVFLVDACDVPTRNLLSPLLPLDGDNGAMDGLAWRIGKADTLPNIVAVALERAMDVQMAEYRRLLYVAMTRARDRLYVCGALGARSDAPPTDSWYALVEAALAHKMTSVEVDGETRLRLTTDATPQPHRPETPEAISGEEPHKDEPLPAWLHTAVPPRPAAGTPLRPSRLDPEPGGEGATQTGSAAGRDAALLRGNFVHRLLELLPGIAADEIDAAAERLGAMELPQIDAETRRNWAAEALAVLRNTSLAPFFASPGLAEVSVAGTLGVSPKTGLPVTISGQIDRLVVGQDEVLVVDFKTNRVPPSEPQGTPLAYLAQLAAYRAALQPQFPRHRLRLVLLWTASGTAMEIGHDLLDQAQKRWRGVDTSL